MFNLKYKVAILIFHWWAASAIDILFLFLLCNNTISLFYNLSLHLVNILNCLQSLFVEVMHDINYSLWLGNLDIWWHVINMLLPVFFFFLSSWWQYFKMDPENYDNYRGVEHLKYCFEVCCGNVHLHIVESRIACFCWFVCSHAWNFDKVFLPICFRLFIFKISCQWQYNLNQFNNMILYLLVWIHRIGIGILKVIVGLNGIGKVHMFPIQLLEIYLISGGWVMNVCIEIYLPTKEIIFWTRAEDQGGGRFWKSPTPSIFI